MAADAGIYPKRGDEHAVRQAVSWGGNRDCRAANDAKSF
jgi:hypothetical protein